LNLPSPPEKILVIRRDNIGDLICTTPLIRALRQRFPEGSIDALVNSYNRPVLEHNEDIDHVYAYTKAKHREPNQTVAGVYWRRLKLMLALRRAHYDIVILANGGYLKRPLRLARWVAPRGVVGFVPPGATRTGIDHGVPIDSVPRHEVENIYRLLGPLGIEGPPPGLRLAAAPEARKQAQTLLAGQPWYDPQHRVLAIHISARKVPQRWPAERFAELMQRLHAQEACQFLLFWSPGDERNPHHPGDDRKAQAILAATRSLPVLAYPTEQLEDLIGGLSVCQQMICSDGGAMHIGAALGLPIVCFFGNSDARVWRPWGVPHELLQTDSRDVGDISVEDALAAYERLSSRLG
jgi:heptosyltransferase-3